MSKTPILSFNSGELSPEIDARIDTEKYGSGCRRLENMIPTKYGGAKRTPGRRYIARSYRNYTRVRMMAFKYSASVVYPMEMGHEYIRFYYNDQLLTDDDGDEVIVETPFQEEDLFQIQSKQIGDVMRLVHPSYPQYKLSRTSATEFEIEEIPFRNGPFLTRNDLVDPTVANPTQIYCTVTETGQYGSLIASASVFQEEHEGALFKLWHPRANKHVYLSGSGTTGIIKGKGTYNLITRGTWTGTITWQRNENNSGWETLKEWKSSTSAYQNVSSSYKETSDSAQHRITSGDASSAFRGDFSIDEPLVAGIVKVLSVVNSVNATVEVYTDLDSTDPTIRWAEGSWSAVRGYPAAISFFEDRCVYAGASAGSAEDEAEQSYYPDLINL